MTRGYEATVRRLIAIKPATLTLTPEARALFFAWRDEIRTRQWAEWEPLKRDGFIGKLAGNTARLACLLKLWEDTDFDEPIDALQMRNAIALARYFVGHMLNLLGTQCSLTLPAKETLALLVKNGESVQGEREIKRTLVERKLFPTGDVVDAALEELERTGYIRRTQQKTGGRPLMQVEPHPDLLPKREEVEI